MTRDDLKRFQALEIDFESIGLIREGRDDFAYFCTPVGAELVGCTGCDGIHFILLAGDERVFCVDPGADEGQYVLPVGSDFREFLSFLLYCRDSNPLAELQWEDKKSFRREQKEAERESRYVKGAFYGDRSAALNAIARAFGLSPADPFDKVKAMQAEFDGAGLTWSDEYYDTLGLENPRHP